jgi:hypothetical protein
MANRISDKGEPYETPAFTWCLSMALPSIIISTVLSERNLSIHSIRPPSLCLTFIKLTCLPFAMLGMAALMSMRSTPLMCQFVQSACNLSTKKEAASMADRSFLLPI